MSKTTTGQIIDKTHRTYKRYLPGRSDARIVVLGILQAVQDELAQGNDVNLEHLGTLAVQERESRAQNFGKDNPNYQPDKTVKQVTFRDGAALKRRLND